MIEFLPILDPWFYVAAIPAVLLLGISKSGFGAGFGSLAVPIMALTITVPQAAAILLPLLFVMDMLGLMAYRKEIDWKLFKFLVPFGLVGIVVGTLSFKALSSNAVAGITGIFTLLFLAQRLLFPPKSGAQDLPRWLGALLSATSGFTSFVAHAGSPPINAYVIPLKLKPIVFTATLGVFFTCINLAKWLPYAWLGLLDMRNFGTSLALMPLAPLGVWIGVNLARRIQPGLFYALVYWGMGLTGLKLVWDGFIAP